jgi:hypothetical protein
MLAIEYVGRDNICIAVKDNDIPSCEISKCPKQACADFLEEITKVKINPYEADWLTLELTDTYYDNETKAGYLIYVCRVGEKLSLQPGYSWSDFTTMKAKLDKIKGLV